MRPPAWNSWSRLRHGGGLAPAAYRSAPCVRGTRTRYAAGDDHAGGGRVAPPERAWCSGGMRVLVTGAAGFIGSTVVDQLLADGHQVVAVDLLIDAAHTERPSWALPELRMVDVRDEATMTALLEGVDVVCHQAAMVGLGVDAHDAPDYVSHNVLGTSRLLSAMARAGVLRLVQASSMVVYGDGAYACAEHDLVRPRPRRPADLAAGRFEPRCPHCGGALGWHRLSEESVLDPRTTYAATKLAQEHLAAAWVIQVGGRAISLRYHNVYGPRMPRDTPYAGVASLFRSSLANGLPPRVFEDGGQMRDFVEVSDVAAANVLALTRLMEPTAEHQPEHRVYNIASGSPRPILEVATQLAELLGGPAPEVVGGGRPGDVRHIVADPGLAAAELGFRPAVDFAAGMRRFAEAPMRTAASR